VSSASVREDFKIAPLFAADVDEAEALLRAMASRAPAGQPLFLDVPACNLAAASLAERMQMTAMFETIRMYTGQEPDISVLRTYGLTSFEIG
jgi:GNAT acetyltransferase-like protein